MCLILSWGERTVAVVEGLGLAMIARRHWLRLWQREQRWGGLLLPASPGSDIICPFSTPDEDVVDGRGCERHAEPYRWVGVVGMVH